MGNIDDALAILEAAGHITTDADLTAAVLRIQADDARRQADLHQQRADLLWERDHPGDGDTAHANQTAADYWLTRQAALLTAAHILDGLDPATAARTAQVEAARTAQADAIRNRTDLTFHPPH